MNVRTLEALVLHPRRCDGSDGGGPGAGGGAGTTFLARQFTIRCRVSASGTRMTAPCMQGAVKTATPTGKLRGHAFSSGLLMIDCGLVCVTGRLNDSEKERRCEGMRRWKVANLYKNGNGEFFRSFRN